MEAQMAFIEDIMKIDEEDVTEEEKRKG